MTQPPLPIRPASGFLVGRWRADPAADTLTLDGTQVKLEPRAMRLLVTLADRAGAVCSSQDLLDAVWTHVSVTEQSLYQGIGVLRKVLGADAATPEFIVTVPRKGYRLVAPVRTLGEAPSEAAPPTAPARRQLPRTIAVLPFRDQGLPAQISFLADTLLGDLILELSRQPALSTIARGTMLHYAARACTARQVAQELGVPYVVDGTIAVSGGELVITCELIDASCETVLANEAIRLASQRWPELAQLVAGRLARALRLEVSQHAARGAAAAAQDGALELAMRAWVALYCRPQTRETNQSAWAWALEASRRDPSIGAAWNVLAYCEWRAAQYGWHAGEWAPLLADALAHAQRAVGLAPADPDAHYTLGLVTYTSGAYAPAEAHLRNCLQISASYAPAHALLGLVRAVRGCPQETAALCERAFALSPREPMRAVWNWSASCAASMLGQDAQALEQATLGIAANPAYPNCHLIAAVSAWRLGRLQEAGRCVAMLRDSVFSDTARVRAMLPPMRIEPWASAFLADLHAAGLPTG